MSLPPFRRRSPDTPLDHERARALAAERLQEPLASQDDEWLANHLAGCGACRENAAAYEDQRRELRGLPAPEPPRDLWARTSAALDREARRSTRGRRSVEEPRPSRDHRAAARDRSRLAPLGVLIGALVVAVVVGRTFFGSDVFVTSSPEPVGSAAQAAPVATPLSVGSGQVAWLSPQADGTFELTYATVSRVCPASAQPDCAPIGGSSRHLITLSAQPRAVLRSPSKAQIVVLDAATKSKGGSVIVLAVPTPEPAPSPSPASPANPAATASASGGPALQSSVPSPSSSVALSPTPTPKLRVTPAPTASSVVQLSASPSFSPSPSPSVPASPLVAETPTTSPEVESVAIISNVVVVGETASYSPDGQWFAFSARPADGAQGPDIYVWHVGDPMARSVTSDHTSVFAGWFGGLVMGSRPESVAASATEPAAPDASSLVSSPEASGSPEPSFSAAPVLESPGGTPSTLGEAEPMSFFVDPWNGLETPFATPSVWRPVVDPTGRFVVYWAGTIAYDATSQTWSPSAGQLVLADWLALAGTTMSTPSASPAESPGSPSGTVESSAAASLPAPTPVPTASPGPDSTLAPNASGEASPSSSASPNPSLTPEPLLTGALGTQPIRDWDVRWDGAGLHFALWVADPSDAAVGHLSLFALDAQTGRLVPGDPLLEDAPALPGFSIDADHLAWATPPGQNNLGSQLEILAWSGANTGQVESQPAPGGDAMVVVR